uniref:Palmitoyltransferase n=1 Tax=Amphimedon queenslandica TaxID=400682 RepID=A0A1X7UUN8_AMPQE
MFRYNDTSGVFAYILSLFITIYTDTVTVYVVLEHGAEDEGMGRKIACWVFHFFCLLTFIAHTRASFTNPGYVTKKNLNIDFKEHREKEEEMRRQERDKKKKRKKKEKEEKPFELQLSEWTVCTKCESYRPPRAHHCKHCNRCVRRMDHHCHWINNCVGIHNYKFFFLFVCYSEVLVIGAGLSLIWDWRRHKEVPDDTLDRVLTFGLFIIDALFTFFVNGMLISQILAVLCNRTFVEVKRYGRPVGKPKESKMSLITAVCGRGPMWLWCLPFTKARIPDPIPPSDIALNQFVV